MLRVRKREALYEPNNTRCLVSLPAVQPRIVALFFTGNKAISLNSSRWGKSGAARIQRPRRSLADRYEAAAHDTQPRVTKRHT